MTKRAFGVSLLLVVSACGPSGPDPDFTGTWVGVSDFSSSGVPQGSASATLTLIAEEKQVRVRGFCPDGSGEIGVVGEGRALTWSGEVQCRWPPGSLCTTSILHYTRAEASLSGSNGLLLVASGVIRGCGYEVQLTNRFVGTK